MTTMENNVYERVAEYLTLMGRTELLTCSAMQNSFSTIRDQAKQLTREYNLQCCYLFYPVLKQHIQYDFEACDNDPVTVVTADHESAAATLSKEARRLANKIARENNNIKECFRKLQNYSAMRESGQKVSKSRHFRIIVLIFIPIIKIMVELLVLVFHFLIKQGNIYL